MIDEKLRQLKTEAQLLEVLLNDEVENSSDAVFVLKELKEIFAQIKTMDNSQPIGRIRFDRLFIEGELADNTQLADCYSKFANLAEGLEV